MPDVTVSKAQLMLMTIVTVVVAVVASLALSNALSADSVDRADSPDGRTVEVEGSLRDYVDAAHQDEYDALMADPAAREKFFGAFQAGVEEAQQPATDSAVRNVLAYGFDRDHVWVTASYADIARGVIAVAVTFCRRYAPAFICTAAGNWLTSMARGYAPLKNHGVWGAIYWNRYAGGRW